MSPKHASRIALAILLVTALPLAVWADPWERAPGDNGTETRSELAHGSAEIHDLKGKKGGDQDWWRISQKGHASYEVVVDAATAAVTPLTLDRVAADGTTVLQSAVAIGVGAVRSLRWQNTSATTVDGEFIRVRGACTKCARDDSYRIRLYETTYAISRFNNSGTQVTVLVIQNPTDYTVNGTSRFWAATGDLVASNPFTLAPKATLTLATQTIADGASGSITVAHDGRYAARASGWSRRPGSASIRRWCRGRIERRRAASCSIQVRRCKTALTEWTRSDRDTCRRSGRARSSHARCNSPGTVVRRRRCRSYPRRRHNTRRRPTRAAADSD